MRGFKRTLAIALSATIILQMLLPVYAEGTAPDISGLTECHTEHNINCGYSETTTIGGCTHEHTDCGYTESTAEQLCTFIPSEDAEASPSNATEHTHDETCGYVSVAEGTPCTHEHDENCGYGEKITVTPCTHSCEICKALDSGEPSGKDLYLSACCQWRIGAWRRLLSYDKWGCKAGSA